MVAMASVRFGEGLTPPTPPYLALPATLVVVGFFVRLRFCRGNRFFETTQERRKRKYADNRRRDRMQRNRERKAQQYQY